MLSVETSAKKRFTIKTKRNKFCRKTCWKEQTSNFTVYLMNHIFQTSALFKYVIMECIEPNCFCKYMKKVRSSLSTILVFKVGLPPSKKIFFINFNYSPSKMMKNTFYFILLALVVLKIFKLLS